MHTVATVARIHYEIPDDLHRKVKSEAALKGLTLKDFIIRALEEALRKPKGR